ncbi:MAG: helix-turn-helix transcriptional regulator, partial [bacterium]|nr:helix-turn-helix transcriptional regulator [bacterium]
MQDKRAKFLKVLAAVVKKYREKSKVSINQAAHEIDLSKSIWSVIEQGKRDPQLTTLWKIAEVL